MKKENQESDIDENEYTEEISKINDDDSILVIKKEDPLDIESEEHSDDSKVEEINKSNKNDNIPPKFFNIKEARVVDKKSLILNSNKNDDNTAYEYSITFLGKKYYRMTNKKDIELYDNIYYYCNNHRTLKNSNETNSK